MPPTSLFFIKTILFKPSLICAPLNLISYIEVKYSQSFVFIFTSLTAFSFLLAKLLLAKISISLIYISAILSKHKKNKGYKLILIF